MELMHWHDSFSVGVHLIDEHHQRLFSLVNELIVAAETQQQAQVVGGVFDAVLAYTQMHFRAEEELFKDQPNYEAHRAEHLAFERELGGFFQNNPSPQPPAIARFLNNLTAWLQNHVLQTDIATFSRMGYRPRDTQEAIEERLSLLTLKPTVLVVEDSREQRLLLKRSLESEGFAVLEASNGNEALRLVESTFDLHLVVTDIHMPEVDGFHLIEAIRARQLPSVYIIVITASSDKDSLVKSFNLGANDFLTKPVFPQELHLRIRNGMNLMRLESQEELIFSMAKLADCRSPETGQHLDRVQNFTRLLGRELIKSQPSLRLSEAMVSDISRFSPLHDIGKVAIADAILKKPGPLTPEEFLQMQEHATIGGNLIGSILRKTGSRSLSLAYDLTMHHHEKWDGSGYPSGLSGKDIPIAARIMALADVYDALTSERVYKRACTREEARDVILASSGRHFDPLLVEAFDTVEDKFHQLREDLHD